MVMRYCSMPSASRLGGTKSGSPKKNDIRENGRGMAVRSQDEKTRQREADHAMGTIGDPGLGGQHYRAGLQDSRRPLRAVGHDTRMLATPHDANQPPEGA